MSGFDPKRTSAPVVPVATSARFWHQPRHECTKGCQQHLPENLAGGSRAACPYRCKPRRGSWPDGQASVDANRLALRSQTETDDVAVPEPGDGEDDGEKRQQHAEDEEGFAARDRRGEPVVDGHVQDQRRRRRLTPETPFRRPQIPAVIRFVASHSPRNSQTSEERMRREG
jgi:ribosome modulation factor